MKTFACLADGSLFAKVFPNRLAPVCSAVAQQMSVAYLLDITRCHDAQLFAIARIAGAHAQTAEERDRLEGEMLLSMAMEGLIIGANQVEKIFDECPENGLGVDFNRPLEP
jgi:hypothetical protein